MTKTQKRMFENIYDVITKSDFETEAKNELDNYISNKEVEWDGDNHTIKIGKRFTIKLIEN